MKNNSKAAAKRTQVIMSEPCKILVGSKTITTKSGKIITVNVYQKNTNAKPIKTVLHPLPPPTDIKKGEDARSLSGVPHPQLSPYQIERNKRRSEERDQNKNRATLLVNGNRPFKGSIRQLFTGEKRCGITNRS